MKRTRIIGVMRPPASRCVECRKNVLRGEVFHVVKGHGVIHNRCDEVNYKLKQYAAVTNG